MDDPIRHIKTARQNSANTDEAAQWIIDLVRKGIATHAAEPAPVVVEPVAWQYRLKGRINDWQTFGLHARLPAGDMWERRPLYAHPPRADLAPTGNTALVEALTLAANRLAFLTVEQDTGSEAFYRVGEWADEARAALQPAAPQPTPEVEAAKTLLNALGDYDRNRSHPAFEAAAQAQDDSQKPAPFNQIGDGLIAALEYFAALARGSVAEKGER